MTQFLSDIMQNKRQTNIELLRIIAMFLVLGVHANFYSLGTPTVDTITLSPVSSAVRIALCIICCMCVNIFILISGWFSIKSTKKGFLKFAFQCLYFSIGIYVFMIFWGKASLSWGGIMECFFITKWDWFIKAYIALYILSPVLNAFVEKATKRQLAIFIILFYIFQTIYAFRGAAGFILNGYSVFNFIGLYMIGRYLKLYVYSSKIDIKYYWIGMAVPLIFSSTAYFIDAYKDTWIISGICMSYANPIMILAAASTLMLFANLKVRQSAVLNFVAASAFAAYLFHYDPNILQKHFCRISQTIFETHDGISCIVLMIAYLVIVFLIAILLDQPRKWLWKVIEKAFFSNRATTNSAKVLEIRDIEIVR